MSAPPGAVGSARGSRTPRWRASVRARASRLWPRAWWARVLLVWLACRAFSAVVLLVVARTQAENPWTGAAPSYTEYTGLMWDASWYREIAEVGYPDGLPRGWGGRVSQSAWAFFPLFPAMVRGVMVLTGGPWQVVAPTLALVLGTAAALAVHLVLAAAVARGPWAGTDVGRWLPLAGVAVLGLLGAAPVLQAAYTESLALLVLAAVLWCLVERQYLMAAVLLPVLGLTRAVALPVVVAVLAHAVARYREGRAAGAGGVGPDGAGVPDGAAPGDAVALADARPRPGEWVAMALLAATAVASGLLWPAIVGLSTGTLDAYTRVQSAWRGRGEVVPLLPWLDVAQYFAGPGWALALTVVGALAVALVTSRALRSLGPELWGWTAGYLGYLAVAIEPGTPLVRFLLLAFPVAPVLALPALRARRWRTALAALLVVAALSQVAWVATVWRLVPPTGWPP